MQVLTVGTVKLCRLCIKAYVKSILYVLKNVTEGFLCLARLYKSSRKDKQTQANMKVRV